MIVMVSISSLWSSLLGLKVVPILWSSANPFSSSPLGCITRLSVDAYAMNRNAPQLILGVQSSLVV